MLTKILRQHGKIRVVAGLRGFHPFIDIARVYRPADLLLSLQ